jgi:hypothetical protein
MQLSLFGHRLDAPALRPWSPKNLRLQRERLAPRSREYSDHQSGCYAVLSTVCTEVQ